MYQYISQNVLNLTAFYFQSTVLWRRDTKLLWWTVNSCTILSCFCCPPVLHHTCYSIKLNELLHIKVNITHPHIRHCNWYGENLGLFTHFHQTIKQTTRRQQISVHRHLVLMSTVLNNKRSDEVKRILRHAIDFYIKQKYKSLPCVILKSQDANEFNWWIN